MMCISAKRHQGDRLRGCATGRADLCAGMPQSAGGIRPGGCQPAGDQRPLPEICRNAGRTGRRQYQWCQNRASGGFLAK